MKPVISLLICCVLDVAIAASRVSRDQTFEAVRGESFFLDIDSNIDIDIENASCSNIISLVPLYQMIYK